MTDRVVHQVADQSLELLAVAGDPGRGHRLAVDPKIGRAAEPRGFLEHDVVQIDRVGTDLQGALVDARKEGICAVIALGLTSIPAGVAVAGTCPIPQGSESVTLDRQECYAGEAEDAATVLSLAEQAEVPYGTSPTSS